MRNLLVGLIHADYSPTRGGETVDWQRDGKYYQYWVRGDSQGRFTIPNVRPGAYTLRAFADGVLGEYAREGVVITANQGTRLGTLGWAPVRYGRQLWEIGFPDRTAGEYSNGDRYWRWGIYNDYPKDFPDDVNYVIGKSDYHKDWNLMQVPRATDGDDKGRGTSTTWSVTFELDRAPKGRATLRLSFAGTEAKSLAVGVNDIGVGNITGLPNTGVIHRDSNRGYWFERAVSFDASVLKAGKNVLKLTVPAGGVMNGVEYDYVRLELDEGKE
jgi:rhamnogalacturonan endolyase